MPTDCKRPLAAQAGARDHCRGANGTAGERSLGSRTSRFRLRDDVQRFDLRASAPGLEAGRCCAENVSSSDWVCRECAMGSSRRAWSLLLESQMHALMSAGLLGMGGLDALDLDPSRSHQT